MALSFKSAVKRAKSLYRSGGYKKFSDAVKAAYKKGGGPSRRQTGKSVIKADRKRKAKLPGKRVTRPGHSYHGKVIKKKTVYYERRKNRSDKPGSVTGIMSHAKAMLAKALLDYDLADTVKATREAAKRKIKWRKEVRRLFK